LLDGEQPSKIIVKSKSEGNQPTEFSNLDMISAEVDQDVTPSMMFISTSNLI